MKRTLMILATLMPGLLGFILESRAQPVVPAQHHAISRNINGQGEVENRIGEVTQVNLPAGTATMKTDSGEALIIVVKPDTVCFRVPAGATTLAKAVGMEFTEVGVGDRVLVRGFKSVDGARFVAQRLIALSKADVEKKREHDIEEWRRRGIVGVVKDLNLQNGEIHLESRSADGTRRILISPGAKCDIRRYASDSVKFADARNSSLDKLRVGDQLRALGDKSGDGRSVTAEAIVYGSFQTVGATVVGVDYQKNEINAQTLDKKRALLIVVRRDSVLQRIPPQQAQVIAQKVAAAGSSKAMPPSAKGTSEPKAQSAEGSGQTSDIQRLIDALPGVSLANIRAGDVIALTSAAEQNGAPVTAIKIVAGVDAVLKALSAPAAKRQTMSLSAGLPSAFDFSVLQP